MKLKCLCSNSPANLEDVEPNDHNEVHEITENESSYKPFMLKILHYFRKSFKCVGFCQQERSKKQYPSIFHDIEGVYLSEKAYTENPRIFCHSELYIGSNGFSKDEVLGSGGFGKVYRAILPSDGTIVAVKCLMEKGEQIEKTFAAELLAVSNLRHRNLVRLRGWCVHDDQLLLVYDYMPNRSLDRVLFGKKDHSGLVLSWERRKKIVHGLSAALFYLHEQLTTQIIHRDVKASNVMLDSNFNARLGDFGLARWLEHDLYYQTTPLIKNRDFQLVGTTNIGGTIGYLPPESFQKRGSATAKSDVFSFGIVALEVASGRRAIDLTVPDDEMILLDWVRRLSDEGILLQAADIRFRDGSYELCEMERLIHIGLLCTLHNPQSRPNMKWVVEALSGTIFGNLPNLPSFRLDPLYISLSSPSGDSTSSSVTTSVFNITSFFSANGETMYLTMEDDTRNKISPKSCKKVFPTVETPREISYKEIISATNNFSELQRVAEVDFGTAYHGYLENSHHVIIKRLGMKTCPALRIRFSNEFKNLARLHHRNLVQLRGWCTERGEMLVVYDYSPSSLLSHFLFQKNQRKRDYILKWSQRYNIIKSLASAIHYLHEEWDEQVIHKNITSSAIALDPDMNPRLGSFALAEFLSRNENGHNIIDKNTSVRGIFGYMSPEYMETGEATTMTDVYSFGVVLLEVATGHMAVDFQSPEVLLVKRLRKFEWTLRSYQKLADWRLNGEYNHKELMRVIKLGMACTLSNPELRPSMKQIVSILDGNDKYFMFNWLKKEQIEEWRERNADSLSLIRKIQALGVQ